MKEKPLHGETSVDRMKREAGIHAAELVEDGMIIGLGTGSTTLYAMEHLSVLIEENGLRIQGVPTSFQTEMRARQLQIPLTTLDASPELDLAIDGADQVDPDLRLIKGRGAAMTREKCVAAAAGELVIVVDAGKCVRSLTGPVPLEVIPFALHPVILGIRAMGGIPVLRNGIRKDGPVITDNGNFVLDCSFGEILEPERLEGILTLIPGVLSCGLFCEFVEKTTVVVGEEGGCRELKRS
ncbi:MAG: ribose-5-phosphate isomerase RpiA [Methanoregulaceae archaeon]|jgi:ribose 5-phosphate isomerase A|nr:ribose-5-phosphate isomerase RpiA [Methanoregulaceae archaeon]